MTVKLRLRKELRVPLDGERLSPKALLGKTVEEIKGIHIWEGNRKRTIKDFFDVQADPRKPPENDEIGLIGDLSKVRRIGAAMTTGHMTVQGDVGMRLGEEMQGGTITVEGDADSWVGSRMRGGTITVKGNAGDYVGGAYRGSSHGMRGGTIVIHGNAGTEVGRYMTGGLIKVSGKVNQFAGIRMKGGTIVVEGLAEQRAGAFMTGGKIVLCNQTPSVLPTFTIESVKGKAKAEGEVIAGPFYLFVGDLTEHGNGRLYVSRNHNPHLEEHEKLLQQP
jgi:formylmethanofuran dehydrogenase subunit C